MLKICIRKGLMHRTRVSLATLLGLGAAMLAAQPAAAQTPADVAVLAGSCANCHGTDGRSPGQIVSIAGRPETVLLAQLKAFKSDTPPPGTTIMNRIAKGYSDEQLSALAAHFSKIGANAPASAPAKKRSK